MTDLIVRATALHWVDDDFPGWVEVSLVDAGGRSHRIVEKVPVLATTNVTAASTYPLELWLRAEYERMDADAVLVRLVDGVETTEGLQSLVVASRDVRWL